MLDLNNEEWKFIHPATLKSLVRNVMITLPSNGREFLSEMLTDFGNKSFLSHNTHAFHHAPSLEAYKAEEKVFSK